jgi:DNA-binding MarR family transcriptional regulator
MHNFYNMLFFHNIHHLQRHIDHFFGHGQVLKALSQKGPMSQSELLEIVAGEPPSVDGTSPDGTSVDSVSLGKTLSELEKQKFITRSKQRHEDKQDDVFSLTKRGEHFAKRLQIHEHFVQNISESLSDEEQDQLTAIIEKLHSKAGSEEFAHFHFRGSHFDFDGNHHEKAGK